MAKHEIMIHENTGATKDSAPYLGSYISKDTIKTDAFAAAVAEKCGLPAIQVQAVLAGSFDAIEALEKESLVRINLDGGTVAGVITGSFPTSDATFDPVRNALILALYLDDDVRLSLADETPAIVTDASVTRVRVDHVMDEATPRPYEVIHGQYTFQVQGYNLVTTDVGASVTLVNAMGATFPCTVVQAVSKQLLRVRSTALLEAGDYKLVVTSRGGDAEGPLQVSFRKVKYLKIVVPAPTVLHAFTDGTGEEDIWAIGAVVGYLNGTNLAGATVATEVKKTGESEWQPCEATVNETSDTLIKLTLAESGGAMMAEKLRFTVTTLGGTVTKVLESFT